MPQKHLASLDGLRGLAILLVVFYHLFPHRGLGPLGLVASASWCGVDLFFVLSGFLITGILFDGQRTADSRTSLRNFFIRRLLRLLPISTVVMLVVAVSPHPPNTYPWWINLLFAAYGSNIVLFVYPAFQFGLPLVTGHVWSLAVEEQFYLVWPWLVRSLGTSRRILLACLAGSTLALALRIVLAHTLHRSLAFLYLELPTRCDSLLLGGAAAMLYRIPGFLNLHRRQIRLTGTLAALAFVALALHAKTFFFYARPINTWGFTLLALASTCLLLLAATPGTLTGRVLAHPFLRFYGRYSYGLYLIHQLPAQYDFLYLQPFFARHLHPFFLAEVLHFTAVLAVATVLAVLSFHLIEQPFLRLKHHFPDRPYPQPSS